MHPQGTALAQEAEGFTCNAAMLGCERWLGQDAGCKGHSSQLHFNYTSMVEQPMNFQPYNPPPPWQCLQPIEQVG